jgi:glucose-6-phosphate 1-epimerase
MLSVLLENEFGRIELFELSEGLQAIRFTHQRGHGSVSLYGGQVLSWQPTGQRPVFWLSDDSKYSLGSAIRGGIPLCWPWFGGEVQLADGNIVKTSNHGFARQSQWQFSDLHMSDNGVEITLSLIGEQSSPLWPTAYKLTQKLVFNDAFQQTLTMKNLSDKTVTYTGALHSYFCVGSTKKATIPAINDLVFDDKITSDFGSETVLKDCTGPVDRIYHGTNSMIIIDNEWQREIEVASQGCQQWVMWNPGEGAETMSDVHAQAENEFICLEAANTRWQNIASQASVSMSQTVTLNNKTQ